MIGPYFIGKTGLKEKQKVSEYEYEFKFVIPVFNR